MENRQAEVDHFQDVLFDPLDAPPDFFNETHHFFPPTAHFIHI